MDKQPASDLHKGDRSAKAPQITDLGFGTITVNGTTYVKDIVIEGGAVRKRKKGPSKEDRARYGHTPLTPKERIPWECRTLVIGTGMYGKLPVVEAFEREAERRGVKLVRLRTPDAVDYFLDHYGSDINAIFHITC